MTHSQQDTISLRDITAENFEAVITLSVCEDQKNFVASNLYSIAEAKVYPDLVPLAIYAGEDLVGFTMFGFWPERNEYWIARLMIDAAHQRKGYGRAAMRLVIDRLRSTPGCGGIFISYEPQNTAARALYASLGFVITGEILEAEEVACLSFG
jgi:diamine N-acetyltransferase